MEKKILLAIDDSENARRAVEFVANFFAPENKITLFNVIPDTATLCAMNSPGLTPYFISQQSSFCLLEEKKKKLVNEAMQKAKRILLDAKFEEKNITIKSEIKKKGIARDIIREAKAGYNVSKYLPFGPVKSTLPYLARRAEENTAIAGQMSKELAIIAAERKRRKLARAV